MAIFDNLFGVQPEYFSGLLGADETEKLRKQAMTTGLVNSAIALIAQPRNQRFGSALPYIGRALMAGQQAGQGVYNSALQGLWVQQKIAELKRQQEQRKAFDEASRNIYTTIPAKYKETQVSGGGFLPGVQQGEAPNFNVSEQYAPPTIERIMTEPERRELNPEALMNIAMSGDPRTSELFSGLKTIKEFTTPEKEDYITLSEGQIAVSPTSGKTLKGNEKVKEAPSMTDEPSRVAFAKFNKPLNQLTPQEMAQVNEYIEERQKRVAGAGVPSQAPSFKDAGELRKEYNANPQIKAFAEVQNAFDQIKTGIEATSAAGDLTAATKFMKLLDPGSVVRDTELGMAMAANGLIDRALAYKDYIAKGTNLSPMQRADFLNVATQLYNAAKSRKDDIENQYSEIAQVGGLDPKLVIGNPQTSGGSLQNRIMKIKQQRQGGR